jgi:hypothetical protein
MKWLLLAASVVVVGCTATPAASIGASPVPTAAATPAAPTSEVPTLAAVASGCVNPPPDLAAIVALDPPAQLACFGNTPLTFQATVGKAISDCGIGPRIVPSWFCLPGIFLIAPTASPDAGLSPLPAYWDPATGLTPSSFTSDKSVQVTGQFDAPAAQTCHVLDAPVGQPTEAPADVILGCREEFVITSMR